MKTTMIAAFALALTTFAATTEAQTKTFSGSHGKSYGNSWLGGSYNGSAYGRVSGTFSSFSAYASLSGSAHANFLQQSAEVARGSAYASSNAATNYVTGSLYLRLAGKTMVSTRFSQSITYGTSQWTRDLFATDPFYGITIAGKRIGLFGNVGVGLKRSLTFGLSGFTAVAISGFLEAWGYGRCDLDLAIAGLSFRGTFAKTTLGAYVTADLSGRLRALVSLTVQAIRLRLKAWVNLLFTKPSWTAIDMSAGSYFRELVRSGM